MNELIQRLNDLAIRHKDLVFDLRGDCRVLYGIAVAYHHAGHPESPASVMTDALEQDGIISITCDPLTGAKTYMRCRLFTDTEMAMRFARAQGQIVILNLNRSCEVRVSFVAQPDAALVLGARG